MQHKTVLDEESKYVVSYCKFYNIYTAINFTAFFSFKSLHIALCAIIQLQYNIAHCSSVVFSRCCCDVLTIQLLVILFNLSACICDVTLSYVTTVFSLLLLLFCFNFNFTFTLLTLILFVCVCVCVCVFTCIYFVRVFV